MNAMATHTASIGAGHSRTLVWKFGGTSVATFERLRAVAARMVAARRGGNRVIAVLSAMGKFTDELVELAYQMSQTPPTREMDALLVVGEQICCALAAMTVETLGETAVSLTGEQAGVRTDSKHGNARLLDVRPERITSALDDGAIVLVTGFQGMSPEGDLTTLGRGGSDASAVAVAAGLGLPECEIFTDVPAVFTADPRLVPEARPIRRLRHEEMLELAEAGAGVLQPRAVELAAAQGVDIHLRSSFTAEEGTWVRRDNGAGLAENAEVVGVAHRNNDPIYATSGVQPNTLVAALAERGASVGALQPEGGRLRFTAPGVPRAEVAAALASLDAPLHVDAELASVSVVSLGITRRPELIARVLGELADAGIPARFVTTTPNRVSVHVDTAQLEDTARLLHRAFVLSARPGSDCEPAVRERSVA